LDKAGVHSLPAEFVTYYWDSIAYLDSPEPYHKQDSYLKCPCLGSSDLHGGYFAASSSLISSCCDASKILENLQKNKIDT
jgi:hypothetical protein